MKTKVKAIWHNKDEGFRAKFSKYYFSSPYIIWDIFHIPYPTLWSHSLDSPKHKWQRVPWQLSAIMDPLSPFILGPGNLY